MSRILFKNVSGETIPAGGCVLLSGVEATATQLGEIIYSGDKPDGSDGLYVINGPIQVAANKTGYAALPGTAVRAAVASSPAFAARVGPVSGSWELGSGDERFLVIGEVGGDGLYPVSGGAIASSTTGGGGAGSGCCSCICIGAGDILVDGYETTSRWTVSLPALHVTVAHGTLTLPVLGAIVLTWDEGDGYWSVDVSADVTATYNDDSDATGDLESDVSCIVKFEHDDGTGYTKLTVSLDGSIPNPVQGFGDGFDSGFE